tara:strand:- start:540 stop:2069 length:1530 start_codon:yes stop_codon:yes gene_type:complete
MANPNKFTTKEVLNKVLLDSSGNAVTANSVTAQEALNTVLDTTNNRLNMSLAGGTISGDVTITGDLTVNSGTSTLVFDESVVGDMSIKGADGGTLYLQTSHDTIEADDVLGQIHFQAPDDTGVDSDLIGATIQALATATFSDSVNSTDLIFKTGDSEVAVERMRIDSTGTVTISHAIDPLLVLNKTGGGNAAIHFQHGGVAKGFFYVNADQTINLGTSTTNPALIISPDGATTVGVNNATASSLAIGRTASIVANTTSLDIGSSNTAVSKIKLYDNEATDAFYIESNSNFAIGYNTTDIIEITQAGNVFIKTSLNSADDEGMDKFPLNIVREANVNEEVGIGFRISDSTPLVNFSPGGAITFERTGSTSRGGLHFKTKNGTSAKDLDTRLSIAADGTLTGSSSNDISDEELKENIKNIENGLDTIKKLQGRTFTWKESAAMQKGTKYGVIAQEIEKVIPDLVYNETGIRKKGEEGSREYYKSVNVTGIIPVLIEAVKELSAKVEALENK